MALFWRWIEQSHSLGDILYDTGIGAYIRLENALPPAPILRIPWDVPEEVIERWVSSSSPVREGSLSTSWLLLAQHSGRFKKGVELVLKPTGDRLAKISTFVQLHHDLCWLLLLLQTLIALCEMLSTLRDGTEETAHQEVVVILDLLRGNKERVERTASFFQSYAQQDPASCLLPSEYKTICHYRDQFLLTPSAPLKEIYTIADIAKIIGRSKDTVENIVRQLELEDDSGIRYEKGERRFSRDQTFLIIETFRNNPRRHKRR